ncbi:SDR family oxidoreductase [Jongsikchunia kroppenstedtii]|uniref:SDR family oxidoreductase n=1 Tax=Jongsikchunia kroppenstedtii TaxID=1121721 RepID=UPI00035C258D|nr:SDR family oxidoreductase [Jongsikchunia kroppenstedtii]
MPTTSPRIAPHDAVVLITGGARGIGAATASLFAAQGAKVWIGDVDHDVAVTTAAGISRAAALPLDVTDRDSWRAAVDTVLEADGRIDVLINNAGIMPLGAFADESDATTDLILDVNVRGMLAGMRTVVPHMVARGRGHVVNVASMAGMIPIPGMVTYNASKYGALGASLAARQEYAGTGVTVSAILPAAVRTELASGAPLGKGLPAVDPEDVAAAIVKTLSTRKARVSVPGWIWRLWSLTETLVPEPVMRVGRRVIDDRRALTSLDPEDRRAYTDRIDRQTREHAKDAK